MTLSDAGAKPSAPSPAGGLRRRSWLLVRLGDDTFGLPVAQVKEIVAVMGLARLDDAPFPVRGAITLRERAVPVVDLRQRLGLEPIDVIDGRLVVVESQGRTLALLVDAVDRLLVIDEATLDPLPPAARTRRARYLYAVHHAAERLVLLLDLEQTLRVDD